MSSFSGKRAVGIAWAVLANSCFAAGNLLMASYPSAGGVYLWRGLGSSGVFALWRGAPSRRALTLGLVHAAHMFAFVLSVRVGPAWLAPTVLGGVPALLWFWGRQKNPLVNAAVAAMAAAAVVFSWGSDGTLRTATVLLAVAAALLVAARMHYASMWVGEYDPRFSLFVAYAGQVVIGLGFFVFGADTTFALWLVVGMVASGAIGHFALYETAKHCSPSIASAFAPLSVVLTAAGVVVLGGQAPTLRQATAAVVWLAAGVTVALIAQNHQIGRASTLQNRHPQ